METATRGLSGLFLVTPKDYLTSFTLQKDRDFFSGPIQVEPFACTLGTKRDHLLYVQELVRDERYPVNPKNLRYWHQLSCKQQKAARTPLKN